MPYGVDVAPDGGIWFSQLNLHRIGRVDPDTLAIEMIDTPFTGPRRLGFDSQGKLWIPGFSSDLLARFDPRTETFLTLPLPTRVTYTRELDFDAEGRVWTSNSNLPTWQVEGAYPRVLRVD